MTGGVTEDVYQLGMPLRLHLEAIGRVNRVAGLPLILIPWCWNPTELAFFRLSQEKEDEMIGMITVLMMDSGKFIPEFI
jgi:hypothetical protein